MISDWKYLTGQRVCATVKVGSEKELLLAFKNDGRLWRGKPGYLDSWGEDKELCSGFDGVTCTEDGHVQEL